MAYSVAPAMSAGFIVGSAAGALTGFIAGLCGVSKTEKQVWSAAVGHAANYGTQFAVNTLMVDPGGIAITGAQIAAVTGTGSVAAVAQTAGTGTFAAVLGGATPSRNV